MAEVQKPVDELYVVIQTPEGVMWEGEAQAISSRNSAGTFDVLPDHANMITMIEKSPITIIGKGNSNKEFKFQKAILSVQENRISVYGDIASNDAQATVEETDDKTK